MVLQFAPFSSAIDTAFWYQLSKKKLDIFKLDDKAVDIWGFYTNGGPMKLPPIANIDYSAFESDFSPPPRCIALKGSLINTNTLEDFKQWDKKKLLQTTGSKIWEAIKTGKAVEDPSLLQSFLCFTFADLKKYHFFYWIAFPALTYPELSNAKETKKISEYFTPCQLENFLTSYDSLSNVDRIAFLLYIEGDKCHASSLKSFESLKSQNKNIILGFADPSPFEEHPGWPLRNLLALVSYHWGKHKNKWEVLCYREFKKDGKRQFEHSIVVSIDFDPSVSVPEACPDVVGWEKNKNQLIPRKVNMSADMDPVKLADAAVDLNLKLMRWRLSPDLQLQVIRSSKCLLFGAGTLGCNVARCLMGWGVRTITFVDNGVVSYSNPVRQSLFTFSDCQNGGSSKAMAAAKALQNIFPGVNSTGVHLSVPMPGHAVSEKILEQIKTDVFKIEELVESHDIIFLLMDTRESRWLPTLLGAAKGKIVVNAALGFDTFLVMRHGLKGPTTNPAAEAFASKVICGSDLGCYFCNDIVAPGNSLVDRTLDQQCTVTRPGVSYMGASLAVELMVSILQHKRKGDAPASMLKTGEEDSNDLCTELGIVPHQIRGYLHHFQNSILTSRAFDRCIACSEKVIENYKSGGFNFLLRVFNEPHFLEEITGLAELVNNINMDEICELSDNESI